MSTGNPWFERTVALAAMTVPSVYLVSKLVETAQGGDFTDLRLVLTYLGEAGLPFVLLGLWAVQRPAAGRLALLGAVCTPTRSCSSPAPCSTRLPPVRRTGQRWSTGSGRG